MNHITSFALSIRLSILAMAALVAAFFTLGRLWLTVTLASIGVALLIINLVILFVYFRCPHCRILLSAKHHHCPKCTKKIDWL